MEKYYPSLLKCPLFSNISEHDFPTLLFCINASLRKYKNDEYLFLAGDEVNYIGILISGSLELIKENPAGAQHIVSFLEPTNLFAEAIVCTRNRISPVSLIARGDCEVLLIPYEKIIKTCSNACGFHLQLIRNMMIILGERNNGLFFKIELLTIKSMREKIATYLLLESQKQNALLFQIIPNRNELADYLNVSRTSMCRELSRMKDLGLIDYYQNSFKILSVDGLQRCLLPSDE